MKLSIPIKPKDVTWTEDQWKAIWATGQDTLVSAAAGSGKTAVLIERLIKKIISKENPIDVDELLVVTFTSASASEMRNRMSKALEEEIAKDPKNQHLRRQLSLVNKAQISTLHSFCLSVVRQYAYLLDIDPGFRIGNEGELALLKDDILSEVLEEAYSAQEEEELQKIYRLVDSFTSDRNDQEIEILIEKLYEMSRVQPEPTKWLHSLSKFYDIPDNCTIEDLEYIDTIKNSIILNLEEALAHIFEMRKICLMPGAPDYGDTINLDIALIQDAINLVKFESWEKIYQYFNNIRWSRLPSVKKDSCDPVLQKNAQKKRKAAKDIVDEIKKLYFLRKPERLLEEIRIMRPIIDTLIQLTERFGEKFQQAKLERGLVDFSDLEHYALAILSEEKDGKLVPSPIAKEYQKKFKEVLIDEYQDTNMIQETILQLVKSGDESNGNLFMVGDVKQSIYRFRLAEPNLFLTKYKNFLEEPNNSGLKIDLNANFRSRKQVLYCTNFIFNQIMGEKVGEIDYDEKAKLNPEAKYDKVEYPVEVAIIHDDEEDEKKENHSNEKSNQETIEEELEKMRLEARFIIMKIRELIASGATVYNPKEKDPEKRIRPIQYSDIVILLRSTKAVNELIEEFKLANIPIYAESQKGYFETIEVMVMMNLLKVVDNPYQDIPLASVLRAPFIGLTENELAKVRLANKKAPFFDAVKAFVEKEQNGVDVDTAEKLRQFLSNLSKWRDLARTGSLADLIWQIYLDTNYYEMVGAMSNGKQRQANLRALLDRAIAYEKTSFRGLFRFLRFIERMRLRGDDLGEAKAIGEKDNVVRVVTIHSSKGLEYPVVFVADLGYQFNEKEFINPYLFDQQYGLAVKAIDPELQIQFTSLPYLALKEKKKLEIRAEEMRILYVAMTRAMERLYLVGSAKKFDQVLSSWCEHQSLPTEAMLPEYVRAKAKSYLDWIGPAISRHDAFKNICENSYTPIDHKSKWKIERISKSSLLNPDYLKGNKEQEDSTKNEVDSNLLEEIQKRFTFQYPYLEAVTKQSKTSVSEIKRIENMAREEEENVEYLFQKKSTIIKRPLFVQQTKKLTQAEIGTIVHTIMQHVPQEGFEQKEEVDKFLSTLVSNKLLSEEEVNEVESEKIVSFFKSPIGKRFKIAKRILRELPFTYSRKDEKGDAQIIQGIVDCLMEDEEGRWVLLDYKTDKILPAFQAEPALTHEMKNRYEVQLRIYSEAIESILNIQLSEKVLYLYNAEKEIHFE